MRRTLLAVLIPVLALLLAPPAFAQDTAAPTARDAKVAFLKEAAVPIRTIEPADEDFADLEPLIPLIGNARVVLLGEQTHGDGACFLAKSRLIKFLHQKMGFDVLAFESGMFDMAWVDEGMRNNAPLSEAHQRGLFGIWAASEQCRELLEYVRDSNRTERPVELAGFDSQFSSHNARDDFPRAVEVFFRKAGPDILPTEQRDAVKNLSKWLAEYDEGPTSRPTEQMKAVEGVIKTLDEKREILTRVHAPRDIDFMRRCLKNQLAFTEQLRIQRVRSRDAGNIRDAAMGENLAWLADDYYKGRKVIVWAASYHNIYDAPKAALNGNAEFYDKTITMGHTARKQLGDAMYSVMFLAHHGKIGRPWSGSNPIQKAPADTLDAMLHEAGLGFAYLDLKTASGKAGGAWLKEPLTARPLGYAPCTANWTKQCDAFFFTDEMTPSTLRREPKKRVPNTETRRDGEGKGEENKDAKAEHEPRREDLNKEDDH
ncbi:MAG TPA: erythromycin esterase family protein [Phycisphaerales bacterium]|nr:erythromycin esterase family protein [Phycisphaerales bacterium]